MENVQTMVQGTSHGGCSTIAKSNSDKTGIPRGETRRSKDPATLGEATSQKEHMRHVGPNSQQTTIGSKRGSSNQFTKQKGQSKNAHMRFPWNDEQQQTKSICADSIESMRPVIDIASINDANGGNHF
mmetsp:Transcript_16817/g.46194  ORF Transcript_16817/g.46194 Transcript_16817/m.46194 type:complete len:128 (-) Transcript_16817:111-494(-)